jgi:DNA-binding MarR family transcriptional regulator
VADDVDLVVEQWKRERPDLDPSPIAVVGRLSKLAKKLESELGEGLSRFGLSEGDFDALCTLRRSGKPYRLTPTELAEAVLISAAGMTKRLDRLERADFIRREPSPADRRSTLIALTPSGRRIADRALTSHLHDEERLLASLDAGERAELAGLLARLLETPPTR